MTDEDTLALGRDVRALLNMPEFCRVFDMTREAMVAELEGPATAERREDLVHDLRALKRLRSRFESLPQQADAIRSYSSSRNF